MPLFNTAHKKILDIIGARLANITTVNEYSFNAIHIERGRLSPFRDRDLPAINFAPIGETVSDAGYNFQQHVFPVGIQVHTKTYDDIVADLAGVVAADVITSLFRDTTAPRFGDTPSYELGGFVAEFNQVGYDYNIGTGQHPWLSVTLLFDAVYFAPPGDVLAVQNGIGVVAVGSSMLRYNEPIRSQYIPLLN